MVNSLHLTRHDNHKCLQLSNLNKPQIFDSFLWNLPHHLLFLEFLLPHSTDFSDRKLSFPSSFFLASSLEETTFIIFLKFVLYIVITLGLNYCSFFFFPTLSLSLVRNLTIQSTPFSLSPIIYLLFLFDQWSISFFLFSLSCLIHSLTSLTEEMFMSSLWSDILSLSLIGHVIFSPSLIRCSFFLINEILFQTLTLTHSQNTFPAPPYQSNQIHFSPSHSYIN